MNNASYQSADLCSVCCKHFAKGNSYYCSKECEHSARKLRRRFDRTINDLRKTGWGYNWNNGVQLKLNVANSISWAIPYECRSVYLTPIQEKLDDLTPKNLWTEIDKNIGSELGSLYRALLKTKPFNPDTIKRQLETIVKDVMSDDKNVCVCSKCNTRWIYAENTFTLNPTICATCASGKMPF